MINNKHERYTYMYMGVYVLVCLFGWGGGECFLGFLSLLSVESLASVLYTYIPCTDSVNSVILLVVCARYVSSQVDGMHVCICAFSLYVGGQYAFVAVPGGVGIKKNNKNTSPPTEMDSACFSG